MSYDDIAAGILHGNPPPHDYIVDVVEDPETPGLMWLRLYADDVLGHPDSHAESLTNWLNNVLHQLNTWTTAKWSWQMVEKPK